MPPEHPPLRSSRSRSRACARRLRLVESVDARTAVGRRLALGFLPGTEVRVLRRAPLGDPTDSTSCAAIALCLRRARGRPACCVVPEDPRDARPAAVSGRASLAPRRCSGSAWSAPELGQDHAVQRADRAAREGGNYPGVTVERREGEREIDGRARARDRPARHLQPRAAQPRRGGRPARARAASSRPPPDALVVVADACTLERSLPFVAQVLRRGLPDLPRAHDDRRAAARGGKLDLAAARARARHPRASAWSDTAASGSTRCAAARRIPRPGAARSCCRRRAARARAGWADSVFASALVTRGRGRAAPPRRSTASCCTRSAGTLLFAAVMVSSSS